VATRIPGRGKHLAAPRPVWLVSRLRGRSSMVERQLPKL